MATQNGLNLALSGASGSGSFAGTTSPTFVTPNLGAATATSLVLGVGSTLSTFTTTTWVPVVTYATPGDLNVAYSIQVGKYTKIGNIVVATLQIITSTFTFTTASGNFIITGLPFPASTICTGDLYMEGYHSATLTNYALVVNQSSSTGLNVYGSGSAVSAAAFSPSQFTTATNITLVGSITYIATTN